METTRQDVIRIYQLLATHGIKVWVDIDGIKVACVAPEWMFRFKTAYTPTAKDIADVAALANHFGFAWQPDVPRT
jgi:hypothetical protein